ncbi:MAG: hypothetical protein WBP85_06210 [Terracidiphilus sp.]
MQSIVRKMKPAQDEVHKAAHEQDLIEVPKRAKLDRELDEAMLNLPVGTGERGGEVKFSF